jgi:hypothetical protein
MNHQNDVKYGLERNPSKEHPARASRVNLGLGRGLLGEFHKAGLAFALMLVVHRTSAEPPCGRYTLTPDTVYDTATKLTWQRVSPPTVYTWGRATSPGTAQHYCATLALAGGGWRLPTIKELYTLVDVSQASGTELDPNVFSGLSVGPPGYGRFWSATPSALSCEPSFGWLFERGSAALWAPSTRESVLCVR